MVKFLNLIGKVRLLHLRLILGKVLTCGGGKPTQQTGVSALEVLWGLGQV